MVKRIEDWKSMSVQKGALVRVLRVLPTQRHSLGFGIVSDQ